VLGKQSPLVEFLLLWIPVFFYPYLISRSDGLYSKIEKGLPNAIYISCAIKDGPILGFLRHLLQLESLYVLLTFTGSGAFQSRSMVLVLFIVLLELDVVERFWG